MTPNHYFNKQSQISEIPLMKKLHVENILMFLNFCKMKVPEDDLDKPKYAAHFFYNIKVFLKNKRPT